MQILLVDDDRSSRRLLDAMLSKMGHDILHAEDGEQAWEIIQKEKINFVLSDWRMPKMDGIDLCKMLRQNNPEYYTYVVLFTGLDQHDDMIIAMRAGADDFLTKPVNARELEVRIQAGKRVLELEESLIMKNQLLKNVNQSLKDSQQRIQNDLQAAAQIQQDLLPSASLENYPIKMSWAFLPAEELAGDIFNFFAIDEHHIGFYLADVSGHGVPAAMLSVHIAKSLSAEPRPESLVRLNQSEIFAQQSNSSFLNIGNLFNSNEEVQKSYREPKEVAHKLNEHFQNEGESMMYFTMIYGVLNTKTGDGCLCQAGHPYPIIARKTGEIEKLGAGGFPIGLVEEAEYTQLEFHLNSGDRLLIYSDGVTECMDQAEEQFGFSRLSEIMQEKRNEELSESVDEIKSRLATWHESDDHDNLNFEDDASMLVIELQDTK